VAASTIVGSVIQGIHATHWKQDGKWRALADEAKVAEVLLYISGVLLLIVPGVMTDALAYAMLLPPLRSRLRDRLAASYAPASGREARKRRRSKMRASRAGDDSSTHIN
jgi:UPF0716 family protein affecting phage T7 exclusion